MGFNLNYAISCIEAIIAKFPITIYMTFLATVISLTLGILFAVAISYKVPVLSSLVQLLSSILKGVPILVLLYVFYYAMPTVMTSWGSRLGFVYDLRNPPKLTFAIIAFAVAYAPYMCDMILSAMETVPKGQMEACYSMGFTTFQGMKRIIIPQLIIVAIPNFGNHFINLLKATALSYMVTVIEMMGAAKNYAVKNQKFLETYIVAALIYWIICIIFERIFAYIEKNVGKYRNKVPA